MKQSESYKFSEIVGLEREKHRISHLFRERVLLKIEK